MVETILIEIFTGITVNVISGLILIYINKAIK